MRDSLVAASVILLLTAITPLPATANESVELFNGKDFSGWRWESDNADVSLEEVWSIKDGIIACQGRPAGYIRTEKEDFKDYVLTLEWRWPGKGGNNGVLVHTSTPKELGVWPKSLEVQLGSDNAGDFWVIGTEIDVPNEEERREDRRHRNLTDDSEKPLGEWNKLEITCRGDEVLVKVNGELVNHGTNSSVTSGAISLQSEGTPIEFRDVRLKRIAE